MSIKINYTKSTNNSSGNVVLFVDEKFNCKNIKKYISSSEFSYINDIIKTYDLKKKIFVFELNSKRENNLNFFKKKYKKF